MSQLRVLLQKRLGWIIFIIVLLIVQALCDLSLPDYTANIVNIGIGQSGIDSNVPKEIRQNQLDKLVSLMPLDQQQQAINLYERNGMNLKQKPKQDLSAYEQLFGQAILMASMLDSQEETGPSSQFQQEFRKNIPPHMQNLSGTDIFMQMPPEQQQQLKEKMDQQLSQLPENVISTAASGYIKEEYLALGKNVSQLQLQYILLAGFQMLLLVLLSIFATITVVLIAARVSASFCRDIRSRVFSRVLDFSNQEMDDFSVSSLITRSTNDIQQIQTSLVLILRMVFYAPLLGIGAFIKVLNKGSSLTWTIGLAVGTIFTVVLVLFWFAMPKFKQLQKLIDKVNLVARESLSGIMVVRAFGAQDYEEKRFDQANKQLTHVNLFLNRLMALMLPTMFFIMNASSILIVWVGSKSVDAGTMQLGDIMAVIQYSVQVIMAFLFLTMISVLLPRSWVCIKRIGEIFDKPFSVKDPEFAQSFDTDKHGWIEFRNVSYRYPNADENVLENISFAAKPGETIAFIGSTGSGKSTLMNLIPRFFDVTKGEILLNGQNIMNVSKENLRERIGYVPQKGILFSGTIASNICYAGDHISKEDMKEAGSIAQANEFIAEKPDQYETQIAQNGSNVSGGQKQRLSIARAIAKKPEFYLFDDSFSALDFKTDAMLRQALKPITQNSTVLIVAQRINTITYADRIYVLDEGRIVGKGTHKQLLQNCEVYQQIASSQLSKEELNHE